MKFLLTAYLLSLAFAPQPASARPAQEQLFRVDADLVMANGAIYLVEPEGKWAQAVAIRQGKIIGVGTDQEMLKLGGKDTRVIDLKGRMAMPGIVDNHLHLGAAGAERSTYSCNFSNYGTLDDVVAAVRGCAEGKGPDDWIIGQAWSSNLYGALGTVAALRQLDAASGGRPVLLRSESIHDYWANSRAMEIAGVNRDTPDPEHGKFGRDAETGELTGLLLEAARMAIEEHVPIFGHEPTQQQMVDALAESIRYLNSRGVTAFNDALVFAGPSGARGNVTYSTVNTYRDLEAQGLLNAHAALSMAVEPDTRDLDALYADRESVRSERLSMDFAKIFVDGVQVSRTGYFLEPYLPDHDHAPGFRGKPKLSPQQLNRIVTALDARGISVKMHVSGDGATRMALDAIEAARTANGDMGPIHTLAHAGFITDSDIPRARALRAAIDASPVVWMPGPPISATEAAIGVERTQAFFRFKTYQQKGVMIVGGSDWQTLPGEFSDLWSGMEGMVTRKNPSSRVAGTFVPEEAVDVASMIRFYTLNSARVMMMDHRIGSIAPGKDADIIVLDQNLFKIAPDRIADTNVDMTVFAGSIVYEKKK